MYSNVKRLEQAGEVLYNYTKRDLVGTQLMIYLAICNNEGINMKDLAEYLEMPQGSLSRNVKKLSVYRNSKGNKVGFDLIEAKPDYENRRTLALYLTEKGRELRADLEKTLNCKNEPADVKTDAAKME